MRKREILKNLNNYINLNKILHYKTSFFLKIHFFLFLASFIFVASLLKIQAAVHLNTSKALTSKIFISFRWSGYSYVLTCVKKRKNG